MTSPDSGDLHTLAADWRGRVERLLVERRARREVDRPKLTVAVIAYRSDPDKLRECLQSIRRASARAGVPVERLVADCGGNERSRQTIDDLCDTDLVLLPDCTLNEARNAVLAWSEGELLMLADDDGVLEDDAIAAMLRHFESPDIVAVRGRIRAKRRRYLTTLATHYDRGDSVVEDALVVEGHMAVRREAALRAGCFDERLFGGEGLLFSYRLLHTHPGTRIVYAPDVVMRHDFYHDLSHFLRKSAGFADQHGMLLELFGKEPGFAEFLHAATQRKHARPRLDLDERVARGGLTLARGAIRLWARARQHGRAKGGVVESPRRA